MTNQIWYEICLINGFATNGRKSTGINRLYAEQNPSQRRLSPCCLQLASPAILPDFFFRRCNKYAFLSDSLSDDYTIWYTKSRPNTDNVTYDKIN